MCRVCQKASETAGLRCAPLLRPRGEMATRLPMPPKITPVTRRRVDASGTHARMGEPEPKSQTTALRPPRSRSAVPASSQSHSMRWNRSGSVTRRVSGVGWAGLTLIESSEVNANLHFRTAMAVLASVVALSCGGATDTTSNNGTPSGAPAQVSDVKAVAGTQAATVSWTPPAANPAVTYYAVASYCVGCQMGSPLVTGNPNSLQVTGLKANTQYTFAVRAYNGSWGPWSEWAAYVVVK